MRGLAPIISSLLILLVVIFLVTLAYNWALPIVEGEKDKIKVERAKELILELYESCSYASRLPEGFSYELKLYVPEGMLFFDPDRNIVVFTTRTRVRVAPFVTQASENSLTFGGMILVPFIYGAPLYWGGSRADSFYSPQFVRILAVLDANIQNSASTSSGFRRFVFRNVGGKNVEVEIH